MADRKLQLIFATEDDSTFTITLNNPIENPDTEEVMLTMESIAMKGVMQDSKGNAAIGAYGAKLVTTETEVLF